MMGLPPVPRILAMPSTLTPLRELRRDWGDAYMTGHDGDRRWWAARRDQAGTFLTAGDPGELRAQVLADYTARPVPREVAP
jgi:hypothetical protein